MTPEERHSTSSLTPSEAASRAIDEMSKEMPSEAGSDASKPQEETLESHEVIELQTFIERKVWIEEKIRVSPSTAQVSPHIEVLYHSFLRRCLLSRSSLD